MSKPEPNSKVSDSNQLSDQKVPNLERENARLKKLLAEAELDKTILKEAASENPKPSEAANPAHSEAVFEGRKDRYRATRFA